MVFQGKSAGRTGHMIIALTWVDASFSPFAHPNEINAAWLASIYLFWVKEIQDISALKWFLLRLACTFEKACESVWPPNETLRKINLRLLATTFKSVWPVLNIFPFKTNCILKHRWRSLLVLSRICSRQMTITPTPPPIQTLIPRIVAWIGMSNLWMKKRTIL